MSNTELFSLIEKSKQGDLKSASELNAIASNLQFGNNGYEKNEVEACRLYKIAAEAGDSNAMVNYGYCICNAIGVTEKNFEVAYNNFLKAAELGNQFGYSNLGWCYEQGLHVAKDLAKAATWYVKAYHRGNEWAKNRYQAINTNPFFSELSASEIEFVASELYDNFGFSSAIGSAEECFYWWHEGANAGSAKCMYHLAQMYLDGNGCEQDYSKSTEWRIKSADCGFIDAMENVRDGYMGHQNIGLEKDMDKAQYYAILLVEKDLDNKKYYDELFEILCMQKDVRLIDKWAEMARIRNIELFYSTTIEQIASIYYGENIWGETLSNSYVDKSKALYWYKMYVRQKSYQDSYYAKIVQRIAELER